MGLDINNVFKVMAKTVGESLQGEAGNIGAFT